MATRHYTVEIPLDAGDVSGLTPAFSVFKNRVTGSNVTPQPTIVDLGSNFYGFSHDDETLIFWRIDMGESVDDAYRYPSGVIGSGEQYVRNADIPSSTLLLADDYTAPDNEGILAALDVVPTTTELTAALAAIAKENTVAAIGEAIEDLPTVTTLTAAVEPLALEASVLALPQSSVLTPTRIAKLDNLDVAVSSRAASLSGGGENQVPITVVDGLADPVMQVSIVIRNSDDTSTIATGSTDENGVAELRLNNGSFLVMLYKPQYNFTQRVAITIPASEPIVISGEYLTPNIPIAGVQQIAINSRSIGGSIGEGDIFKLFNFTKNQKVSGVILNDAVESIVLGSSGSGVLPAEKLTTVTVKGFHPGSADPFYSKTFSVTDDDYANLADDYT
jgi:hypothetical protein